MVAVDSTPKPDLGLERISEEIVEVVVRLMIETQRAGGLYFSYLGRYTVIISQRDHIGIYH